jgi:hypothetical protein
MFHWRSFCSKKRTTCKPEIFWSHHFTTELKNHLKHLTITTYRT